MVPQVDQEHLVALGLAPRPSMMLGLGAQIRPISVARQSSGPSAPNLVLASRKDAPTVQFSQKADIKRQLDLSDVGKQEMMGSLLRDVRARSAEGRQPLW